MTFGKRLKSVRKEAHLTQAELAQRCGLAAITVRQYESEKRVPNFETLSVLARALGVSASFLLGWESRQKETDLGLLTLDISRKYSLPLDEVIKAVDNLSFSDGVTAETMQKILFLVYFHRLNSAGKKEVLQMARLMAESGEYEKER